MPLSTSKRSFFSWVYSYKHTHRVIAHECDGAMLGKKYDLGERFYHEHQTFVSMKSRSWIVQTVGVAIANATYAAARRIARFAAPLARNVFPTLDMYRTR